MWYETEGGSEKPEALDTTSSKVYVYIRKNFEEHEREEEGEENVKIKYWTWLEQKIEKKDWELYQSLIKSESDITDLQEALVELYEIVTS